MTHVNIDGDVICYAVGFAAEETMYLDGDNNAYGSKREALEAGHNPDDLSKVTTAEPISHALFTAKRMIESIVEACAADTYNVVLTGAGNFREEVATYQPYKGNRNQPKPLLYNEIKDYIRTYQNCVEVVGEEADDYLGYMAVSKGDIIATVDKDLDNVPGLHYNWNKPDKGVYEVSEPDAWRNFFMQILVGDATDNIPGLYRLTDVRATAPRKRPLFDMDSPVDMFHHVMDMYMDALMEGGMGMQEADAEASKMVQEVGTLLWIRWHQDEGFMSELERWREEEAA